jgi:hypothetical protein
MQIHQQENLKMAFDYMKTENVGLVNCSGKDVNEGNENISKKGRSGLGGGTCTTGGVSSFPPPLTLLASLPVPRFPCPSPTPPPIRPPPRPL